MLKSFVAGWPEIIQAATTTPEGLVALLMLALLTIAFAVAGKKGTPPWVVVSMAVLTLIGALSSAALVVGHGPEFGVYRADDRSLETQGKPVACILEGDGTL